MKDEKRNRICAAVTVNVILLIVILAAVVIYQLAVIIDATRQKARIQAEITQLEQEINDKKGELDFYQSLELLEDEQYKEYLLTLAIQNGYRFPDGK